MIESKTVDIRVLGNSVATALMPKRESKVKNSFATMTSSVSGNKEMIKLQVLIGNDKIPTGSNVYVTSDVYNLPWANVFYNFDEKQMMLVPETNIVFISKDK